MSDRVSTISPPREPPPIAGDPPQIATRRRIRLGTIPVWIWLAIILALAAFLRLHALNRIGFNSDEAVYAGQAASISGSQAFLKYFPIYRAHPLLFPAVVSIAFHFVVSDFVARLVAALFGLGTIVVCYHLGSLLYGRRTGLVSAGLLALTPYHVIVSRQALLDGPEVFFATIALYSLAKYRTGQDGRWLVALAGALGLAFLTKETAVVMLGAVFVYFALDATVRLRRRVVVASVGLFLALALVYPVATAFGGATKSGSSFILWQLLRKPNHGYSFYVNSAVPAIGVLVIAVAAVTLFALRRERSWRETMLLSWIGVPFVFFGVWPTKGYQYLLMIAPPVAVLAARGLVRLARAGRFALGPVTLPRALVTAVVFTAVVVSLLVPTWSAINASSLSNSLAGTGGTPGGRLAGRWIRDHVPPDVQMMAIGPSMANVLQFYGDRKVWGLSVSTNPLQRNPVYRPVRNPDLAIREGTIQYIVWDAYSAGRSKPSSERLMRYVHKYRGRLIYEARVRGQSEPVIRIYEEQP